MAERGIDRIILVSYSVKTDLFSAGLKSVCETATILFMSNKMFHRSVADRRNLLCLPLICFLSSLGCTDFFVCSQADTVIQYVPIPTIGY